VAVGRYYFFSAKTCIWLYSHSPNPGRLPPGCYKLLDLITVLVVAYSLFACVTIPIKQADVCIFCPSRQGFVNHFLYSLQQQFKGKLFM